MQTLQAEPRHAPGQASRGILTALAAVFVAVLLVASIYWSRRGQPADGAGSVPFDPCVAREELESVGQRVNRALADGAISDVLIAEVRAVVERYPKFAAARTLWAQVLLVKGESSGAYEQLQRSLELDPAQPEIHQLAGAVAEKLGRLDRAGWHYAQAIALDGQRTDYRLKLANVYLRQQQPERARELMLEALRLDSGQHLAYAMLADLYASQNKIDLALDQIQKAIEHTPVAQRSKQIGYVRTRASLLRRANRPQDSLQVLNSLSPRERFDPAVLADVAVSWAMLGQPGKAALEYEAALEAEPTRALWAVEAARWQLKAGNRSAAAAHLATARALDSSAPSLADLDVQAR